MYKIIIPATLALFMAACGGGNSTSQKQPVALTAAQIQVVKTYMAPQNSDLNKIEFRNLRGADVISSNGANYILVCGEINIGSENFQPFFSQLVQNDFKLGMIAQNQTSASYVADSCGQL